MPLIRDEETHGIMLHFVTEEIDFGSIIQVVEAEIPKEISYRDFRRKNQLLCLDMLRSIADTMNAEQSVESLISHYENEASVLNRPWGDEYISATYLGKTLRALRKTNPNHRVFEGLPEEIVQYRPRKTSATPVS